MTPLVGTLILPPKTPAGALLLRGARAAFRSPGLFASLVGAGLFLRLGALAAALLFVAGVRQGTGGGIAAAIGIGAVVAVLAALVELVIWAGGIPRLAGRIEGGRPRAGFGEGLAAQFGAMLALGGLRIAAYLVFSGVATSLAIVTLIFLLGGPVGLLYVLPIWFLYFGAELLWKIMVWISLVRIGALGEGALASLSGGVRQLLRRPGPHLVAWWMTTLGLSVAGGAGTAALAGFVAAGGATTLEAALPLLLLSSIGAGAISLVAISVYTALALDQAGAFRSPAGP